MLTTWENYLIVALVLTGSLLLVLILNRLWPWERRHVQNDLIGWQLGILGTTYAVMLGFMLYTVWTNFGAADVNVDYEANSVGNLHRVSSGLPEVERDAMQRLTRAYAQMAIDRDWTEMNQGQMPEGTQSLNEEMWTTLTSLKAGSPTELIAEDHALSELSSLTEHRRIRLLQNASRLPPVLWCVLIVGAVMTVGSACLFGSKSLPLHVFQVFALSLLISLVLIAIADIDRPFEGSVHVSDFAFQRARANMSH